MLEFPAPGVTYGNIVPEELQQKLQQIGLRHCADAFLVGDIGNLLVEMHKGIYEVREIQAAVGFWARTSARNARYYMAVSGKIPEDLREEFSVYDLGFSHFSLAAQFPGQEVEILSWIIDNNASIDAARLHFGKGEPVEPVAHPNKIEYTSTPQLFTSLTLHLWRTADRLGLNVDKRTRVKQLLGELLALFS